MTINIIRPKISKIPTIINVKALIGIKIFKGIAILSNKYIINGAKKKDLMYFFKKNTSKKYMN